MSADVEALWDAAASLDVGAIAEVVINDPLEAAKQSPEAVLAMACASAHLQHLHSLLVRYFAARGKHPAEAAMHLKAIHEQVADLIPHPSGSTAREQ